MGTGLEAKAVIVVDVDAGVRFPEPKAETVVGEDGTEGVEEHALAPDVMLYTGATRAKRCLDVTCTVTGSKVDSVVSLPRSGIDEDGRPKAVRKWKGREAKLAAALAAELVSE